MTAKYFAILTNQGSARLANAAALGTRLNLTQMAVGDANGVLPTPDPAQTKLINQKRIAPLNLLAVDPDNTSQIIVEQIIPENEGGFWIREIGLYDDDGILIAVANCPETYKPQLQEGSGRTQTIRMILIVSSTSAITLKIDPSVVLATRKYVDDKVIEVKAYADDLMKKHVNADNPHTQYPLIANALKEMADAGLVAEVLKNLQLGDAAKSDVVQTTGQSEKDVISQKGATENFALKALLDNFGGATLLFNKSRDYSLQLSEAGILSLYSQALDKTVMAWSAAGELVAGSVGIEHLTGVGDAAKSSVVQTTGQSEKDVISQKGATENFALKALLDNFGGATLLFNKSKDYSLQLSDAGALSLYSKALDKVVLAFSKSGELQAGTIGFEHVKELKSAAKKDVGNSAGQIPDMSYFELSGIGSDNMIAKFPNGLIIQVFRRNISNSASVGVATINPVTFPTPFPGAVWGVFCTKMTYAQINTSCESVTNTGFSATTCAVSGVASTTLSSAVFLAVGY